MPAVHVQGATGSSVSSLVNSQTCVLPANPKLGSLVCVALFILTETVATGVTVKDGNLNSYTLSSGSPGVNGITGPGQLWMAYLLKAPANADKTLTAAFTLSGGAPTDMLADEFSDGIFTFDKDAQAHATSATPNTPSITPTNAHSVLYSMVSVANTCTGPLAGVVSNGWTGAAGGITANGNGGEYIADQAASAKACSYTQTSGLYLAMTMAFKWVPFVPLIGKSVPNDARTNVLLRM